MPEPTSVQQDTSQPLTREQIAENLNAIQARIAAAADRADRNAEQVRLVGVTKSVGVSEAKFLFELGVTHLGENRVEEAGEKVAALDTGVTWHMIGAIQRRKARDVVDKFHCVDAVDRLKLAETLQRRCEEAGKTMPILLEVNVSGEKAKHGFTPEELPKALDAVRALDRLTIRGLMTMAPFVDDPEHTRPVFAKLRELAGKFELPDVSMGMTNDFEIAIEEGATEVRIGSALFTKP